jgi:RND family efflux transporter MFP subunit
MSRQARSWPLLARLAAVAAGLAAAPALAEEAEFDCVVDPSETVDLGSAVTGLLKSVLPARGDFVTAGDVVAQLDSTVEEATVALGRLQASSTQEIDAQQTRLDLAEARLARAEELARNGHLPTEQLEQIRGDAQIAAGELARLKLQHEVVQLDLARAEAILAQRQIHSPISGLVAERRLSPGEFVNQDSKIMTIVALDPLYVEAFVPVDYWGRVKLGDVGTVTLEEPIGGAHAAKVTVVDRVFDAASGTFGVRLELPNPDNALPAGLRCQVTFTVPDAPPAEPAAGQ